MDLPKTTQGVAQHSPPHVNRKIRQATQRSIDYHRTHQELIPGRLAKLEQEWDIERTLEANASSLMLAGIGLGLTLDRRFFVLPVAVGAFLLQHALQGWCPPVSVLRRLGVRTQEEIQEERLALLDLQKKVH